MPEMFDFGFAPSSWAWGAPGLEGHAAVPNALVHSGRTVVVHRNYRMSLDGQAKAHQAFLPHIIEEPPEPLALAVVSSSGRDGKAILSPVGGKLALLILASDMACKGQLLETTIGALADILFQDAMRKGRLPRDRERVAEALREIRRISLVLPDDRDIQCFVADTAAGEPRADMVVRFGVASTLAALLEELNSGIHPRDSVLRSYRGQFLINVSGAMSLDAQQPAALRMLVRESAEWNACYDARAKGKDKGRIDIDRVQWRTLEEIARRAHASPDHEASASVRKDARKQAGRVLELLHEKKLVHVEQRGNGQAKRWRIIPPESYEEARVAWREGDQAGGRYEKDG